MARKSLRSKNQWLSSKKSVTQSEAISIADAELFMRRFNVDYYQILKRISDAPTGLRNGAAPGIVGR